MDKNNLLLTAGLLLAVILPACTPEMNARMQAPAPALTALLPSPSALPPTATATRAVTETQRPTITATAALTKKPPASRTCTIRRCLSRTACTCWRVRTHLNKALVCRLSIWSVER